MEANLAILEWFAGIVIGVILICWPGSLFNVEKNPMNTEFPTCKLKSYDAKYGHRTINYHEYVSI